MAADFTIPMAKRIRVLLPNPQEDVGNVTNVHSCTFVHQSRIAYSACEVGQRTDVFQDRDPRLRRRLFSAAATS